MVCFYSMEYIKILVKTKDERRMRMKNTPLLKSVKILFVVYYSKKIERKDDAVNHYCYIGSTIGFYVW